MGFRDARGVALWVPLVLALDDGGRGPRLDDVVGDPQLVSERQVRSGLIGVSGPGWALFLRRTAAGGGRLPAGAVSLHGGGEGIVPGGFGDVPGQLLADARGVPVVAVVGRVQRLRWGGHSLLTVEQPLAGAVGGSVSDGSWVVFWPRTAGVPVREPVGCPGIRSCRVRYGGHGATHSPAGPYDYRTRRFVRCSCLGTGESPSGSPGNKIKTFSCPKLPLPATATVSFATKRHGVRPTASTSSSTSCAR